MLSWLFLPVLADATVFCWPFFRAHLAEGAKLGKLPSLLCVLSDGAQRSIIWGPGIFCLGSNISPHGRVTCLLFSCDWNESLGQVHHAYLTLSQGESFSGNLFRTHVNRLWESPPHQCYPQMYVNYSKRWSVNFFPEGTNIFPSGLFHQLDKFIWSPVIGSSSPYVTQAESSLSSFREFWTWK